MLFAKTISDVRGDLTVVDKLLPFEIKRVFFVHKVPEGLRRGGHGHYKNRLGLMTLGGSCSIRVIKNGAEQVFILDGPEKVLLLEPEDFHFMENFSQHAVLAVFASEHYDENDYRMEPV